VADSLDEAKAAFRAGVGGGRVGPLPVRKSGQGMLDRSASVDDP